MEPLVLVLLTDPTSSILVRGQLSHLIHHGFRVGVLTSGRDSDGPSRFDPMVAVHHVDFVRRPSLRADLRALRQVIALVRMQKPALVNASTPKAGLIGMIASRLTRVRVRVYQVRGLRYETETGWRRLFYRVTERVAMRLATHVLFNSSSLRSVAEQDHLLAPGRGIVLGSGSGNGIDVERFHPATPTQRRDQRARFGLPDDAVVIGFVGRLTPAKGLPDLIAAFDSFGPAENSDVTRSPWLLLIGSTEPEDPLDDSTRRLIAENPRIVHVEWLDDTAPVYAAMDVLAFASYREGLPNVPLEAQACGVPVVGYAATGTVDAVVDGHTGLLVPVGDRVALSTSLRAIVDDSEQRARLGSEARRWVAATYACTTVWERLAEAYRTWLDDVR